MNTMAKKIPVIRRIPKEKVAILHVCSQTDAIAQLIRNTDKLSVIITGNGNPEDGYVYKVIELGKEIKEINTKLTGISGVVTELHEESINKKAIVKTDSEKRSERRAIITKRINVGMFIVGAISLLVMAFYQYKNFNLNVATKTDTAIIKSDMEDVSTVSRGLKYSPYLQAIQKHDTIKIDTTKIK
jgi:hypothetical protein